MLLSTAKRFVSGYKRSCLARTGKPPDRDALRQALRSFGKALTVNKIPL